jgi:predicted transcriptional regulator
VKELEKITTIAYSVNILNTIKMLLTKLKLSDILVKSLEGDKNKQKITAKAVRKKMVFEN